MCIYRYEETERERERQRNGEPDQNIDMNHGNMYGDYIYHQRASPFFIMLIYFYIIMIARKVNEEEQERQRQRERERKREKILSGTCGPPQIKTGLEQCIPESVVGPSVIKEFRAIAAIAKKKEWCFSSLYLEILQWPILFMTNVGKAILKLSSQSPEVFKQRFWMRGWGHRSPKATTLWSNSRAIRKFATSSQYARGRSIGSYTDTYVDGSGRKRYKGNRLLKSSLLGA